MIIRAFESAKQEFKQWLLDINLNDYDYVCLEDDEIYINDIPKGYLSKNALLHLIPEIVNYYIINNKFPKILIVIPFIMSGQKQNEFLTKIEQALKEEYKRVNNVNQEEFLKEFKKSSIYVFGLFDNTTCLANWVQSRLRFKNLHNKRSEWLKSYYKVINEIPIKKDVLSIISDSNNISISDNYEYIEYHDSSLYILKKIGFYLTIYSFEKNGKRIYTPYLFLDNIDINRIEAIIKIILEDIKKQNPNLAVEIIYYLNYLKHHNQLSLYIQISSLLICQVYLKHFINSNHIKGDFNIEEVTYSYGIEGLNHLLKQLVSHSFLDETYNNILNYLSSSLDTKKTEESGEKRFVRDIIYNLGINDAHYQEQLAHNKTGYQYNGNLSINCFMTEVKNNGLNILWCLLFLLNHIKNNNCILQTAMEDNNTSSMVIHPTSLSLGIMPLELGSYWNEFFRLSQYYWREDTFPEKIRDSFTKDIFKNIIGEKENKIVEDAVYLAKMITKNREIINEMLNWTSIVDFQLETTKPYERVLSK